MGSLYGIAWYFFIYAFLGWCSEVVYATLNSGKFVNRGFLNGPYCPIYGVGVLLVAAALEPVAENLPLLFFGSVLVTTLLELVTGFLLERIFNAKWWDYTEEHFNFRGYICVKFSLLWGLACMLVIRVIFPMITRFVHWIPHTLGIVLLVVLTAGFAADLGMTVTGILKIKKKLRMLEKISGEMRVLSDQIGGNLSEGVLGAMERNRKTKQEMALRRELTQLELEGLREQADAIRGQTQLELAVLREKLEALSEKYHATFAQAGLTHRRFRSAYPKLMESLRERIRR